MDDKGIEDLYGTIKISFKTEGSSLTRHEPFLVISGQQILSEQY